jgi:hypothetical protein
MASFVRRGCVVGWAFSYNLAPTAGTYRLLLDRAADPARMKVAEEVSAGGDLVFGKAEANGRQVWARFRSQSQRQSPWDLFLSSGTSDYRC